VRATTFPLNDHTSGLEEHIIPFSDDSLDAPGLLITHALLVTTCSMCFGQQISHKRIPVLRANIMV
jgi:hypothetical protein